MEASCSASRPHPVQHEEVSDGQNEEPGVLPGNGSGVAESEYGLESKHKVFLSHSGAQKDFVEQLCIDLERLDRYPFFDRRPSSLPVGEKFPKLIFDAIKQCQVGVVVLSDEFFMRSKWPMLELNAMVKEFEKPNSRMKIIPLFYRISLNDFKDSKNRNRWILQWEEWASNDKSGRIDVEEWKKAMRTLESINGLVMKEGMGDVKLRKKIVIEICRMIRPQTRWGDSHVQGCRRVCKVICDKMDEVCPSSRVCVVGIYGVGGIGKTTMCKALCNELSSRFYENVCHVEFGQGSQLQLLQKALKMVTTLSYEFLDKLDDVEKGYTYLRERLHGDPIFLALDNVQDDYKSIQEARAYLKGSYGVGSVVLVTGRSLDILLKLNLKKDQCLEMPELKGDEARSLFLNYAGLSFENEVDEKLVRKCMELCHLCKADGRRRHYHPLALKVLGQQLGSNAKPWEVQLSKIVTVNQVEDAEAAIFFIFRNSFDSLGQKQRLVFMDAALITNHLRTTSWSKLDWLCMVHEVSIDDMKDMLEVLKRKSLLEELSDGFTNIGMHDLWQEFAVLESKSQDSREQQWVYQADGKRAMGRSGRWREGVERMCFLDEGWRSLQGLNLADFVNVEAFRLNVEAFTLNVEAFRLNVDNLLGDYLLDLNLSGLKHLKSLDVHTPGLTVRVNGLSSLTNLGFLHVSARRLAPCLDEIEHLRSLQILGIKNCKGVKGLDLSELKLLREVKIKNISDLISLRGLSSRMASLRLLAVTDCNSLQECVGLDELVALEVLRLKDCSKLKRLPWLGRLTNLRELNICWCQSISAVPGLSDLVALEELAASRCSKLTTLPDLVKLTKLRKLDIWKCPVQEVPGLDGLIALTYLGVSFYKLSGEPPDLSKLSALKVVRIEGWNGPIWTRIQKLLMLEVLELRDCKGEDVVPDLQNLKRLRTVGIARANCKDLSGLSNCTTVESLQLTSCVELERLPEFERLKKLRRLNITYCFNICHFPSSINLCSLEQLAVSDGFSWMKNVPNLEFLSGLHKLELFGERSDDVLKRTSFSRLTTLEIWFFGATKALDVSNFPKLKELKLYCCRALERVTCSIPLTALTELAVGDCEKLVEMPDLSAFPQLKTLRLENCRAVTRVTCSIPLTALTNLAVEECEKLVEMPDLSAFPQLKTLRLKKCSAVTRVTCSIPLTALTTLAVEECEKLVEMPDLSAFPRLKTLQLENCRAVTRVTCSIPLTALTNLAVEECEKLAEMPDLSAFPQLKMLRLKKCSAVTRVTCSIPLTTLTTLAVKECEKLVEMPDLSAFPQLKTLQLENCSAVTRVTCSIPLTALTNLAVEECEKLVEMPDLSAFPQLKTLQLENCSAVTRVTCSIPLTALTNLAVEECEKLVEMPDLSAFPQLKTLRLENCSAVTRVTCSIPLTALTNLAVEECEKLVEMPDLSAFPQLKTLRLKNYIL